MTYQFEWREVLDENDLSIRHELMVIFTLVSIRKVKDKWNLFRDDIPWEGASEFIEVELAKTYVEATVSCKLESFSKKRDLAQQEKGVYLLVNRCKQHHYLHKETYEAAVEVVEELLSEDSLNSL